MNVLITGVSGFLGKNIGLGLSSKGLFNVFGMDINTLNVGNPEAFEQINFIEGSFLDERSLQKIKAVDVVIHLARTIPPGLKSNEYKRDIKENLLGSIKLFEFALKKKAKKFIFISSGGTVYGSDKTATNAAVRKTSHSETDQCFPVGMYGLSMFTIENYLKLLSTDTETKLMVLRLSNPFGPYQQFNRGQGFINTLFENHVSNKPTEIWGDGSAIRDYIYVADVVKAIERAIAYTGQEHLFNIGSGNGYSLNDLVQTVEDLLNCKLNVTRKKDIKNKILKNILNCSKAKKELKWSADTNLKDGFSKTYDYYLETINRTQTGST